MSEVVCALVTLEAFGLHAMNARHDYSLSERVASDELCDCDLPRHHVPVVESAQSDFYVNDHSITPSTNAQPEYATRRQQCRRYAEAEEECAVVASLDRHRIAFLDNLGLDSRHEDAGTLQPAVARRYEAYQVVEQPRSPRAEAPAHYHRGPRHPHQ